MELYFLHIRLDMWFYPIFTQTIRPLQIFIFFHKHTLQLNIIRIHPFFFPYSPRWSIILPHKKNMATAYLHWFWPNLGFIQACFGLFSLIFASLKLNTANFGFNNPILQFSFPKFPNFAIFLPLPHMRKI